MRKRLNIKKMTDGSIWNFKTEYDLNTQNVVNENGVKIIKEEDLTFNQTLAVQQIVKWTSMFADTPEERMFVLAGYAGTGKTTILKILLEKLRDKDKKIYVCSTTNEALNVASNILGERFDKTIYGLMGLKLVEIDDTQTKLEPSGKSNFLKYDVVICDESSMISENLFEHIYDELNKEDCNTKIIFVGDNAQLPPIEDVERNESIVFDIQNKTQLTEVIRTKDQNPIIKLATEIRENIDNVNYIIVPKTEFLNEETKEGIEYYGDRQKFFDDAVELFKTDEYNIDNKFCRILAFTNRTVKGCNQYIRSHVYGLDTKVTPFFENERLMIGESPIITDVKGRQYNNFYTNERVLVKGIEKGKFEDVEYFDCYRLRINRIDSLSFDPNEYIYVCDDDQEVKKKKHLEELAKQAKLMLRNNPKLRRLAWKPYFDFKNKWAKVNYIYAMTVHKSQGSTLENVFVIDKDIDICQNDTTKNRLRYVAYTRASKRLAILN